MKNSGLLCVLVLLSLCLLAPYASQAPDPVQKLMGLSGGSGSVMKSLGGLAATVLAITVLAQIFKYFKTHRS